MREASDGAPNYSHLAGIINGRNLVPDGDRLLLSRLSGSRVEIRLASASDWITQTPHEIADPKRARKSHPAVAALRAEKALAHITPASTRARAFRLLNALAAEAAARDVEVSEIKADRNGYRQGFGGYNGYLMFHFDAVRCVVSLSQTSERVPHIVTPAEAERQRRGYAYVPQHDYMKTERLTIHADADSRYSRRESWSDTRTLALEYRLHDVLAALVSRDEAEKARIERERLEAIERREREATATARATEAYYEQRRIDALLTDFAQFTRRKELTDFLTVMDGHAAGLDGDDRLAAEEWIAWCRQYVETLDPFARGLAMPDTKPPSYKELTEFKEKLGYRPYF